MENSDSKDKSGGRRLFRRLRKVYGIASSLAVLIAVGYLLLISFPQVLFAKPNTYGHFTVYSREPPDQNLAKVLDDAEARLQRCPIYQDQMSRPVFLTGGYPMYTLLSHKAYRSFANSVPLIDKIIINKTDIASDLVFVNRPEHNSRSLSGVIAHEVTHLFIRKKYGPLRAAMMPVWKNEGYCEYIAGDSTITFDEGIRRWLSNPDDDTSYRYIKYQAMVKYLLETEKISLNDFFTREMDEKEVAANTFAHLK